MFQLFCQKKKIRKIVIGLFLARCMSHYQAAMLLAERGMTIESLSISRGLLVSVFVMLAIAEDAVTTDELIRHDAASRVKHANALLNSKYNPNVPQFIESLADFVAQSTGSTTINMREFARRGNALATYDGLYIHLSHYAAHPSLSAVNDYFIDGEGDCLYAQLRPLLDKTPAAVLSACAGILLACFASEKTGKKTEQISNLLIVTWSSYERLFEQYNPWTERP